jgi:GT2 family glycosyltransferase
MTKVVATVLVHNHPAGLRRVLDQLASQTRPPDEVVVVDNGSMPPVVDVDSPTLDVHLVAITNEGVGAGHNHAVAAARSLGADAVWLLEHDTFPDPQCLATLLESSGALAQVGVPALVRNEWERRWHDPTKPPRHIDRCTFNGPLMPLAVIDRIGAFDTELFVGHEDWEYSKRLANVGVPVVEVPAAVAVHPNKGSGRFDRHVSATRLYYSERNALALGGCHWPAMARSLMGGMVDLVRGGRGLACTRARWAAVVDARHGRLGRTHRRFVD